VSFTHGGGGWKSRNQTVKRDIPEEGVFEISTHVGGSSFVCNTIAKGVEEERMHGYLR